MIANLDQSWLDALGSENLPDSWLASKREAASASFAKTGLPHRRMEDWKYTDLRNEIAEALPAASAIDVASGASAFEGTEARLGNGFWAGSDAMPQGVEILSLSEALTKQVDWVKPHLGTAKAPEGHPMLALNTALMRDGAVLRIAKNTKLDAPIIISHQGQGARQIMRHLVVVEEGVEATLIEVHQGGDEAQQVQQTTEIFVGANAKLTHIRMQDAGSRTAHLATDLVEVARDATYRGFVLTTGSELARQESFIEFTGPGAEAHISGAYLLSGQQHSDVTTRIHHAVPHCTSREVFKGVIADEARGVFQGKVIVAEGAQKTDGHQLNKTLLLSPKAEIDAKPELEIYADDVKCSHGATSGQLDAGQMFYLRARGIPEDQARGLLIESFMSEALDEVEDDAIREILTAHVAKWLAAHAGIEMENLEGAS